MSAYVALPGLLAIAFVGWLAGMLTFKRSLMWCRECGQRLTCPDASSHRISTSGAAKPRV
ncbi:hypothetical protein ABZU53_11175 [Micromonospora sp. NPDC005194]|uniref:hypothetical protein n=1 Tax=Micromonospora sp. NPDC005194 TaxID=3156870 RepID=UPI0033A1821F